MKGYRVIAAITTLAISIAMTACAIQPSSASPPVLPDRSAIAEIKNQSLVMGLADDYIAALGESVYLLTRSGKLDASKGRWLAQSFLRNGVGACLDIAIGPNPSVSLLDLLVLTSLEAWSFETHWIPAGIGDAGLPAVARLKQAETDVWNSAKKVFSDSQIETLRGLVKAWIAENPDRTVVSLIRFSEFVDERKISSAALRGKAHGLLSEVGEASAAVEDVRLLGERLLWYAGRYPYLLGEQTELTAYRIIDQPEFTQLVETDKSAKRLSDTLTARIESIENSLKEQQDHLFTKLAAERASAITQLQASLRATAKEFLDHAVKNLKSQRIEAINHLFDRLTQERASFLNDITSHQDELLGIMRELRETVAASERLANEMTGAANAVDRVMARFGNTPAEAFRLTDARDTAIETGQAAERLYRLIERADQFLGSQSWNQAVGKITDPADEIIDRLFWRGVILVGLLILGLGLLRLVPQRTTQKKKLR